MPWVIEASRVNELDVCRLTKEFKVVTEEHGEGKATTEVIPAGTLVQVQELDFTDSGTEIADIMWKSGEELKTGTVSTKALVASSEHVPAGPRNVQSSKDPWPTAKPSSRPKRGNRPRRHPPHKSAPWVVKAAFPADLNPLINFLSEAKSTLFHVSNGPLKDAIIRAELAKQDTAPIQAAINKVVETTADISKIIESLASNKEE